MSEHNDQNCAASTARLHYCPDLECMCKCHDIEAGS